MARHRIGCQPSFTLPDGLRGVGASAVRRREGRTVQTDRPTEMEIDSQRGKAFRDANAISLII
jgi:hypothetical protein